MMKSLLQTLILFGGLAIPAAVNSQTCPGVGGCLDPTFGIGGTVGYSNPLVGGVASDLAVHSDGKVVALTGPAGGLDSTYSLIRINGDGSLDPTFGTNGTKSVQWGLSYRNSFYFGYARAIAIQNIGGSERILMAGASPRLLGKQVQTGLRVDRYLADGSVDSSFGTNGSVYMSIGQAFDIEVQPDQKVVGVTIGSDQLFRLNSNGTPDTTFGAGGVVTTASPQSLAIDTDGSIIVLGTVSTRHGSTTTTNAGLRRYRPNGSVDTSFGNNGSASVIAPYPNFTPKSIAIDSLHNILIGARASTPTLDFAAARFTQSGVQDSSFGSNGIVLGGIPATDTQESNAIIQSDGKILLIGSYGISQAYQKDAAVIRLNIDGSRDTAFGNAGVSIINISGNDSVSGKRGGIIHFDPLCACEKILIASGNDHLTTFARLTTF